MSATAKRAPKERVPAADQQIAEGLRFVLREYKGDINAFFLEAAAATAARGSDRVIPPRPSNERLTTRSKSKL